MDQKDRITLALGKLRNGRRNLPTTLCVQQNAFRAGGRVRYLGHRVARHFPPTAQPIAAKIEHDCVQPGVEPSSARLPLACGPPYSNKGFLRDIFCRCGILQHSRRKAQNTRQLRGNEQSCCRRVAAADPLDQSGIRIVSAQACSFPSPSSSCVKSRLRDTRFLGGPCYRSFRRRQDAIAVGIQSLETARRHRGDLMPVNHAVATAI